MLYIRHLVKFFALALGFLTILFVIGCNRKHEAMAPVLALEGINGKAQYVFGKEGKIIQMFKDEYYNGAFSILLDRDTVVLGDDFSSVFKVHRDSFKITITNPTSVILYNDSERYHYIPLSPGLYDFKGTIEYDSLSFPFEYKFIVLSKE